MKFQNLHQQYATIETLTDIQTELVDICWQFPNCTECPLSGKFHIENPETGEIYTYGCLSLFMDRIIDQMYDITNVQGFDSQEEQTD